MTMAFKYQVSLCLRPNDVLLVTLNHMDMIRDFVEGSASIKQQVEHVYRLIAQVGICFQTDYQSRYMYLHRLCVLHCHVIS